MKGNIFLLSAALSFASCSAPTYTYHFDTYDYNSGKKLRVEVPPFSNPASAYVEGPLLLEREHLVVSTTPQPLTVAGPASDAMNRSAAEPSQYRNLPNSERKVLRRKLRQAIDHYTKEIRPEKEGARTTETKQLDNELKLAIIFGAVGITLTVLGGINTILWVLGIAGLVIGLVFFIRWVHNQ